MVCKHCNEKNRLEAEFCKKCGKSFNEEEREASKYNGIIGFIKFIEDKYNKFSLKFIFDSNKFKALLLIIFSLISIYNFTIKGGNRIQIKENENYLVEYNDKDKEYYVTFKNDEEQLLDLHIPNNIETIEITKYSENDIEIDKKLIKPNEEITLNANTDSNDYYIIKDNNSSDDYIKVLVYIGE